MGTIHQPDLVLPLLAAFSRHPSALDWARGKACDHWGPLAAESEPFAFTETDYYEPTMGPGLTKVFFVFERLVDPATLALMKRQTNDWEADYAGRGEHAETRPLNLDPGYLTLGKLVLASTKDHAHRIYLGQGIYAEVTLEYRDRNWRSRDWTFADYQRSDYQAFFSEAREYLRRRIRAERTD
ncbi:MAG: DUF4416 family protein [Planctomycetota bacterium]|nr:MAG: DUF4416 family protein [Planctomycetota bacterium]REJ96865.1 MAG: DUF4416 family protein [Planctomycetota bacterium]